MLVTHSKQRRAIFYSLYLFYLLKKVSPRFEKISSLIVAALLLVFRFDLPLRSRNGVYLTGFIRQ